MIDPKLRSWIIGLVSAVWALNFVAGLIPQLKYEPDQAINAIFMAIVGGLFALGARDRRDDKHDDKHGDDKDDKDNEGRPS